MNDRLDPLEVELAAFAASSPSPELKARIAQELMVLASDRRAGDTQAAGRRKLVFASLATALAACLIAAALVQRANRVSRLPTDEIARPSLAAAFDEALPTVWSYRRAVFASPDQLDELLDKHASGASGLPEQGLQVSAFPMTSTDLDSLLGDL